MTTIKSASFKNGYNQLRKMDEENFRSEFMEMFGIRTEQSFRNRLNGKTEPKISEVAKINSLFRKYGVTSNIWGE